MMQKNNKDNMVEIEAVKKELDEIKKLRSDDPVPYTSITALCMEVFTIICC